MTFERLGGRRHGQGGGSTRRRGWTAVSVACPLMIAAAGVLPALGAGGAFQVDDSEIGSIGECKVESWTAFAGNRDFIGAVAPACVVNIGRPVELGTTFARFRSGGEWGSELVFKGKTNLIPIENNKFGLAIIAGGAASLTDRKINATFVTIPISFQIHEQVRLNVNGGWLGNPSSGQNVASWGAGLEWSPVKQATLIGEVFGFAGGENPQPRFQLGLRYTPLESFDIDVIYGRNLTGEHANWITVGVNVRFDAGKAK